MSFSVLNVAHGEFVFLTITAWQSKNLTNLDQFPSNFFSETE